MLRIASWIAAIFTAVVILLSGGHLQPSRAFAQNIPNPNCAKAGTDFVCIGALDGTSIQQIIVGSFTEGQALGTPTPGYVIIIENTGVVRKRICANEVCPTVTVQ
jgi:hypothetical protein